MDLLLGAAGKSAVGFATHTMLKQLFPASRKGARLAADPVPLGHFRLRPSARPGIDERQAQKLVRELLLRVADADESVRGGFSFSEGEALTAALTKALTRYGRIEMSDVQGAGLNAGRLSLKLYSEADVKAELTPRAFGLFQEIILESCVQIIDFFSQQPEFVARTQVEQLDRLDELGSVTRLRGHRFLQRLRFGLKRTYDNLNVFGLQLPETESSYELSSAFVNLSLRQNDNSRAVSDHDFDRSISVEELLKSNNRVLIEGPAGAGKTTLLNAIALLALDADLPDNGLPDHFKEAVPFVLTLRTFSHEDGFRGPRPEQFVEHVAPEVQGEKPEGWVSELLQTRAALVLIDGLDEVRQEQRKSAIAWMSSMIQYYDQPTYIMTSRPAAVNFDLRRTLQAYSFTSISVQPMTTKQMSLFVDRWHESKGVLGADSLKQALSRRRSLHNLASTPLLCAMMCALHYVNRSYLPRGRVALYEDALTMLLERRDRVQSIEIIGLQLDRHQTQPLLSRLAFWMVMNEQRVIQKEVAIEQLDTVLPMIRGVDLTGAQALQYLLERSGLLQEPSIDQIEFRHPSFQDFLSATEIVRNNYIGFLVGRAHDPLYQDVFIMAVGRAQDDQVRQGELLQALISRAEKDHDHGRSLWLLAAASISDLGVVDHHIAARIEVETAQVVPPNDEFEAAQLATVGEFVLDLVADAVSSGSVEQSQMLPCVHLVSRLDSASSMSILADFVAMGDPSTVAAVAQSWQFSSDPQRYADQVLADAPLSEILVTVEDTRLLPFLEFLHSLRRLEVSCPLERDDLDVIARLNLLQQLHLLDARLDGLGRITQMPALRDLSLTGLMHSELAESLPNFVQLEKLKLVACHTSTLRPVSSLKHLNSLHATRCSLSNVADIPQLTGLRSLDLSGNPISDISPIASCGQVGALALSNTRISEVSALAELTQLTHLYLDGTSISDCRPLVGLTGLRTLSLAFTTVDDLSPLRELTSLERLDVRGCPGANRIGVLANLSKLTELTVQ